jgi:hypothetical protein
MKLNELLDALIPLREKYGEQEVITEGCDCDGDVNQIVLDGSVVYLARNAESDDPVYVVKAKAEVFGLSWEPETPAENTFMNFS